MATEHAARTDTIVIKIEGTDIRLSVTTRYPLNQEDPPSDEQLARIRTGTVMRYTKMYKQAFQWQAWEYDAEAKSPLRVVAESEQTTIQPSAYDPYVTVWQQHWGQNNPPSLTLHDWDNGNAILALNKLCEMSNDVLVKVFKQAEGIDLVYMSRFAVPSQQPQQQTPPPPPASGTIGTSANPIGRNAEQSPVAMPDVEAGELYHLLTAPAGSPGDLMFGTGQKGDTWKFAKWANKRIDYDNKSALQYVAGEIRAFPITGVEIKEANGKIRAVIKTQLGNIDIWKKAYQSDENSVDWKRFQTGMAKLGVLAPQLVAGYKRSLDLIALFNIANSEDGTKEYKNFWEFADMPSTTPAAGTQPQAPKDVNDIDGFLGRKPVTDDFPM